MSDLDAFLDTVRPDVEQAAKRFPTGLPFGNPSDRTAHDHAPQMLAMILRVRELHSDVHQCGMRWYNPTGKPGASIAVQGPCPTMRALEPQE